MKVSLVYAFYFLSLCTVSAQWNRTIPQQIQLGLIAGGSYYLGSQKTSPHGAFGGFATFDATENLSVRGQLVYTTLTGEASGSRLGFSMHLFEADLLGEYNFVNMYDGRHVFTLYAAAGFGLTGNLSLENNKNGGTSPILPLGGGGKMALNRNVQLRLEYIHRITFGNDLSYSNSKWHGTYGMALLGVSIRLSSLLAPGRYE